MFRVCSEYVPSMFRVCSEYVQSMFRVSSEYVQSMFRVSSKFLQSFFRDAQSSPPNSETGFARSIQSELSAKSTKRDVNTSQNVPAQWSHLRPCRPYAGFGLVYKNMPKTDTLDALDNAIYNLDNQQTLNILWPTDWLTEWVTLQLGSKWC